MDYVPSPVEVLSVIRRQEGRISEGDEAWCRHRAGLLAWLMEEVKPRLRRGSGVHPMTGLPLGMGVHASIVACDGEHTGIGVSRALKATIESPMGPRDNILSHARIREIGRRHVTCEAEAYAEEEPLRLIARVEVVLVRVEGGRAVPLFS
jgi:hypothetical protein